MVPWILRRKDLCSRRIKSVRTSLIFDYLLQEIEGKIRANRRVTIRELHHIIPEVSKTTIHEVVIEKLRYRKLCTRWVLKVLTDDHKTKRMVSHALLTGRRWVSGLHCDWRWNVGLSPHSWIQATVIAMAHSYDGTHFTFGGTLDQRCHFKHVSLKNSDLPLSENHGSKVMDQGRRQCCHNLYKIFPIGLQVMYFSFRARLVYLKLT